METNDKLLMEAFGHESVIICIGQSAGGKGTHSKCLIQEYVRLFPDKPYLFAETGQLLRDGFETFSPAIRERLIERQNAGHLQLWSIASYVWMHKYLTEYNGGPVFVDGTPRSLDEVLIFINFYVTFAKKDIIVFHLEISDEEAEARMIGRNNLLVKEGKEPRVDTLTAEARRTKLDFYHSDVKPALGELDTYVGVTIYAIDASSDIASVKSTIQQKLIAHYVKNE